MTLVLLQEEITLRPESVSELFEAVRETTADSLEQKGVTLSVECGMDRTLMDFDLMRSALVNLVENAKNASEPGQQIELRACGGRFEVADRGKGIPPEEIARITEPFYRVDRSRSKLSGGSGLGLALVKRIAEVHGARLEIESTLGEGTTMRLVFSQEMTTV
jgi:signal transduction histidine kinase